MKTLKADRILEILQKSAIPHNYHETEKRIVIYQDSLPAKLITSISVIGYSSIGLYKSMVSEISVNNMLCINL
jgi:hypothetical protein